MEGPHLESIELLVAERLVQVLVREPEDACEGLGARRLQLRGQPAQHVPQPHLLAAPPKPAAHLLGLRVIERSGGVQHSLLGVVEQL